MEKLDTTTRKQQIAESVMEVIASDGIQNLTMKKIADRIGVSDAALYRHFNTKNDMLVYVVGRIELGLISSIKEKAELQEDPLERLKQVLVQHLHYVEKNPAIPTILFSEALHYEDRRLKNKIARLLNDYKHFIEGILTEAKFQNQVRQDLNPQIAAEMVIGVIQSSVIFWSLDDYDYSIAERSGELWEQLEKSLT